MKKTITALPGLVVFAATPPLAEEQPPARKCELAPYGSKEGTP